MRPSLKTTSVLLAILIAGIAGAVIGYLKGAEDWAGYTAAAEAATTVTKLRELRAKNSDSVLRLLESELDGQIARRSVYEDGVRPVKYLSAGGLDDERLMRDVMEYRRAYPSGGK